MESDSQERCLLYNYGCAVGFYRLEKDNSTFGKFAWQMVTQFQPNSNVNFPGLLANLESTSLSGSSATVNKVALTPAPGPIYSLGVIFEYC